jgi:CheY-like chemotaxis protein
MEHKPRILIVDDEFDTQVYFKTILEDHGYEVSVASDGVEALQEVKKSVPDLITLDLSMPEKSGLKFYRELRGDAATSATPVVMISGVSSDMKDFISTRKQVPPPDGYLSKPIDQTEMLQLVEKLLITHA